MSQPADPVRTAEAERQSTGQPVSTREVVLHDVREQPLSIDEVLALVRHPQCGGIAVFVGVVRDHDHGEAVSSLDYSAHPSVVEALGEVCREVLARHDVARMGVVHRVGHLEVGDLAVVAAVSAAHRGAAFEGCRDLVDTLKARVPIWKHQRFSDGGDEWVGLP